MWNSIKERIFPLIIALSALSVSASAAVYSVTGLSMLFAGASTAVMIMAASLEVSKLVIASLLYQYWNKLNKILRTYLTIAALILILITSAGIYGYLSSAYQKTADQTSIVDSKIASLESKKKLFEETRDNILKEKQSIASLQGTLSQASTTQYTDKNGNLVVRSNNAAVRNIESASKSNEKLSAKIDIVNDSIFSIESKILETKTTAVGESELGPLKYLSALTGVAMDKIINWYILVIIFVFDPLAIALVVAANFAFAQLRKTPIYKLTDEDREWLEADLGENDVLEEEEKQYEIYKEKDKEYYQKSKLDLDGDGIVEEEELKEVFDKADTNDDGIIDEEEAKVANLNTEDTQQLNQYMEAINKLEDVTNSFTTAENWKKEKVLNEVSNLKDLLTKQFNKKDDNTITYF